MVEYKGRRIGRKFNQSFYKKAIDIRISRILKIRGTALKVHPQLAYKPYFVGFVIFIGQGLFGNKNR